MIDRPLPATGNPCGLFRRFAAMLYDSMIVIALLMAVTTMLMLLGFRELSVLQDPLYALCLLLTWFAYLTWFWRHGGMTLGMRAWRVRIESNDGRPPTRGQCIARFAISLVSAAVAGLGFVWCLLDTDRRCWHDRVSRTRLLRA